MLQKIGTFLLIYPKGKASRYWEVDALRGVAIVMMVIYHLAFDLTYFGYYHANVFVGLWRIFGRATGSLFILLVGTSLALSHARSSHSAGSWSLYKNYLVRGLKIFGWGMVITLAMWIYMGQPLVIFGILHLIGTTVILAYPFLWLRWVNLVIGVASIALGNYLNQLPVTQPWLLWLGLRPPDLFQYDYFPLLPWFGVMLLGLFAGQLMYPGGARRFDLPSLGGRPGTRELGWLGRRSLLIYLIHQPVLFVIFAFLGILGLSG